MSTSQKTIDYYNDTAEGYDSHVRTPSESIYHAYYEKPAMRAELPDFKGMSVLSIGCGSAVDTQWFLDNGAAEVTGIDISSELIAIGRGRFPKLHLEVMDMEHLGFGDNTFDLVYSSLALHYVDDMTTTLREVRRVLKPGGQCVFSCNHPMEDSLERSETDTGKRLWLGRENDKVAKAQVIHGDYLVADKDGSSVCEGKIDPKDSRTVVRYHRTFSVMFQQITAAGLTVKRIVEPLPTEDLKGIRRDTYELLRRIPAFIIWVSQK